MTTEPRRRVDVSQTKRADSWPGAPPPEEVPDRIDRYLVIGSVGSGAMGVVLKAYDPELDRKVAIKVLRPDAFAQPADAARVRLVREAQAMARLTHPNVVSIHDVGTSGGEVFVAMEYVAGQTLGEWLKAAPRTPKEIVEKFLQAGEGLAAAHAAGILHRDFKPDNVLIDADGRAKVTDFGLARAMGEADWEVKGPQTAGGTGVEPTSPGLPLTRAGAVLGTPAYMAPEQFLGLEVDERTEQFNFCVSLWEALYGERPFAGNSYAELAESVTRGALRRPSEGRKVRRYVRDALARGLSRDRRQRFETLADLLKKLGTDPSVRWRPYLAAVGAGAAVWAIATLVQALQPEECADPAPLIASTWNARERADLRDAFVATGAVLAEFTAQRAGEMIDAYALEWRNTHSNLCAAARAGATPQRAYARQLQCLERSKRTLRTSIEALKSANKSEIRRAQMVVVSLPRVADCVSPEQPLVDISEAPDAREAALAIQEAVDRARANALLGRFDEAIAEASRAAAEAEAVGEWGMRAEASYVRGFALSESGKKGEAQQALDEAVRAADRAGADALRVRAQTALSNHLGNRMGRSQEARNILEHAEAVLERLQSGGKNLGDLRPRLHVTRGIMLYGEGRYGDAIAEMDEGLRHLSARSDPYLEATIHARRADALCAFGRPEEALASSRRAFEIQEQLLGPDHPSLAPTRAAIARALNSLARHREAEEEARASLAGYRRALGEDTPFQVWGLKELAEAIAPADPAEAVRLADRTVEITRAQEDHHNVAYFESSLGSLLLAAGHPREAAQAFERAIAASEASLGADHPDSGEAHALMGAAQEALGNLRLAERHYSVASKTLEGRLGPEHPMLAIALSGLGRMRIATGSPDSGRALLERALSIRSRPVDAPYVARAAFAVAELAWRSGERARALELAHVAQVRWREWARAPAELSRVEEWISEREGTP